MKTFEYVLLTVFGLLLAASVITFTEAVADGIDAHANRIAEARNR